jgi:hypothetical protein
MMNDKFMKRLLTFFFSPRRARVIEIPHLCRKQPALSEAKVALQGQHDVVAVQTLLWVIAGRRAACIDAAQVDAHKGQDTRFQLGAKQGMDDLLADLAVLLDGAKADDELKSFLGEG